MVIKKREDKIREHIRSITQRQLDIAKDAEIHPINLSKFMNGHPLGDKSLTKLEKSLGIEDCQ